MLFGSFYLFHFSFEFWSFVPFAGFVGVVMKFMQRIDLDSQFGTFRDVDALFGLKSMDAIGSRRDPIILLLVLADGFVIGGAHERQFGFELKL